MTITEFLEARIAEDEAAAERGGYHNGGSVFANDNYGCLLVQPARVLAECAAKRTILEFRAVLEKGAAPGMHMAVYQTVKCLAAVYSDHPDYDKGWAL